MNKPTITYINFGIACRIGNSIYINKELKNYPKLHNAILKHEKSHSEGYYWDDIRKDIRNSHLKGLKGEYYKFILKNPSSWSEFMPIWVYDKSTAVNPTLFFLYGLILILFGVMLWVILT